VVVDFLGGIDPGTLGKAVWNNPHEIIDAEVQKKRINNRLESLSKEMEKIVDYAINK
jgi:hypothetical protein